MREPPLAGPPYPARGSLRKPTAHVGGGRPQWAVPPGSIYLAGEVSNVCVTAVTPPKASAGEAHCAEGHGAEKLSRWPATASSCTKGQASPDRTNSPVTLICYDPFACLAGCSVNNREDGGSKRQNHLCLFPRQTNQYHSNPSLCPNQQR